MPLFMVVDMEFSKELEMSAVVLDLTQEMEHQCFQYHYQVSPRLDNLEML